MQANGSEQVCSPACQAVHVACRGCGVLAGPEHVHLLRGGYCESLLVEGEGDQPPLVVPLFRSCAEYAARSTGENRHPGPVVHPLRVLREARGLSQRDLARRVGMSHKTLSRLEADRHRPRPETLRRLAVALDVSPSILLDLVA